MSIEAAQAQPARDYKRASGARSLDVRRCREFGSGALVGRGADQRRVRLLLVAAEAPPRGSGRRAAPEPHRAGAARTPRRSRRQDRAEKYDFYEMLPNFEVVVPEKDKDVQA